MRHDNAHLFLSEESADVGVGTLDHAVEVVDVLPRHVPTLQPRQQDLCRLDEVIISYNMFGSVWFQRHLQH